MAPTRLLFCNQMEYATTHEHIGRTPLLVGVQRATAGCAGDLTIDRLPLGCVEDTGIELGVPDETPTRQRRLRLSWSRHFAIGHGGARLHGRRWAGGGGVSRGAGGKTQQQTAYA